MKKKLLTGTLLLAILIVGCGKKDFTKMTFNDGVYQGIFKNEDKDHPSSAEVSLEIKENKIVNCEAVFKDGKGNVKGEEYGKEAGEEKYKKAQIAVQGFSQYAEKLVEVQDPDMVDAISGATVSNKEFKEAVWNALEQAKK